MEETKTFRLSPQLVLGLIVITLGVIFTLDNLDIIYARDYLRYWPALLIIYGVVKIMQPETSASRFWGIILAFVGAALLVDKLYIFDFRLWDFWPLILVGFGVTLILRSRSRWEGFRGVKPSFMSSEKATDTDSVVNASAFLGGSKRNVHSKDFRGGELTAVMGGCEIDLRNATIASPPAVFDVFAFWGGIEIKVPQNWSVTFEGTPILGGYDDKTYRQGPETNQRLVIRGSVIMGGIEVTN